MKIIKKGSDNCLSRIQGEKGKAKHIKELNFVRLLTLH